MKASAFVRRNSGNVATELPKNELAQFLHKREQQMAEIEDIVSVHNSAFFTIDDDASDRFEPESITDH